MENNSIGGYHLRQVKPLVSPQASITTGDETTPDEGDFYADSDVDASALDIDDRDPYEILTEFVSMEGNISELLSQSQLSNIGMDAVREWEMDKGANNGWRDICEKGLNIATQTYEDDPVAYPWENAADIHYPILTQAAQQWSARAYPELVKSDKVVGVKVFNPPALRPSPGEIAANSPPPANPMDAQASQAQMQQDTVNDGIRNLQSIAKNTRAQRVAHYMNYCIFYKMNNWESDMDLLLSQLPITGSGFKKVYMTPQGVQSDYVSPLHLTVNPATKNIEDCPRITQDFELYPNQIKTNMRSGIYNEIDLPFDNSEDAESPRTLLEQYRYEDLDDDGLSEPYIVTVDVETKQVLRVEPAFGLDDIHRAKSGRIMRIDHWQPFPDFKFIPDPKGRFYGTGFAQLLDSITDTIDTSINQLIDAGNAEIAGGGFIGANVRLAQGGSAEFSPGEYKVVSTPGTPLKDAIWERAVPKPSEVTMTMLNMLIEAAKDIASVKDVITGEGNPNAPVGTTLALQNQALTVFSSIYKRVYQGLRTEFRMMFRCLKKFPTDEIRHEYNELTLGDFDADFSGDGTDIQPVADPNIVTKMQKMSRIQTLQQFSESPVGQAAGMLQPKPAQALALMAMDAMDIDSPERFVADIPPNQAEQQAEQVKTAELAASAKLKIAQAQKAEAEATKNHAQAGREVMLGVESAHNLNRNQEELLHNAIMSQPQDAAGNNAPSAQTSIQPQA